MADTSAGRPKLTALQRRFVEEYLVDLNATQAAIRAGYSEKTARSQGQRLLTNADIAEAVESAMAERSKRTELTQDMVLDELRKLGFANMGDYMKATRDGDPYLDFADLSRDQTAALVEVTVEDFMDGRGEDARNVRRVKFKLADKRAALVDCGRHLGMFRERVEVTGKNGGPIEVSETRSTAEVEAAVLEMAAKHGIVLNGSGPKKPNGNGASPH